MELVEGVEVVDELPAIYLRGHGVLVLADTHLGFEEEMAESGVYIPPFQLGRVMRVIKEAVEGVEPKTVVIAGDFKHIFSRLGRVERRELAEVLTYLLPRVDDVIVVRGNHDNYLPLLRRKFPFKIVDHLLVGRYLIIHGHKDIPEGVGEWDTLIFGHEHPSITIRDSIGVIGKFPCFLIGELADGRRFVTLPAVGAYQTGSRITLDRDTYLSPILKRRAVLERVRPVIVDEEVGLFELPPLSEFLDLL